MSGGGRAQTDAVGDAIRATAEALGPWVGQQVAVWPTDRRGRISPHDPSYLVGVILDDWMGTFRDALGANTLALVHRYRDLRNRWAHNEPLDAEDAAEAQRVAEQLLGAIGARTTQRPQRPTGSQMERRRGIVKLGQQSSAESNGSSGSLRMSSRSTTSSMR